MCVPAFTNSNTSLTTRLQTCTVYADISYANIKWTSFLFFPVCFSSRLWHSLQLVQNTSLMALVIYCVKSVTTPFIFVLSDTGPQTVAPPSCLQQLKSSFFFLVHNCFFQFCTLVHLPPWFSLWPQCPSFLLHLQSQNSICDTHTHTHSCVYTPFFCGKFLLTSAQRDKTPRWPHRLNPLLITSFTRSILAEILHTKL